MNISLRISRRIAWRLITVIAVIAFSFIASAQSVASRTLVIIVPGTWGNTGFWTNEVSEKATFASELKRAVGSGAEIYPFRWDSKIDDKSRQSAAKSLAALIDKRATEFDRVCLVGHSHGGNIALLAAGLCHAKIDMVICLSTPHAYFWMRSNENKPMPIPVYCTWESRLNSKSIVSIAPDGDVFLKSADCDSDLTKDMAMTLTRSWQEHANFPRLSNDDIVSHLIGLKNLSMEEQLNVADANITFHSLIDPAWITAQHSAAHSRRMGYVVGELLRDGPTTERLEYVKGIIQLRDADYGEPIPLQDYQGIVQAREAAYVQIGWRLEQIDVQLNSAARAKAGNLDHSDPSPYVRLVIKPQRGTARLHNTDPAIHTFNQTWNPKEWIVPNGCTGELSIRAYHVLQDTDLGGTTTVVDGTDAPAETASGSCWSATMRWSRVHL